MNAWLLLSIAIALEIAGTSLLKLADGFTRPLPGIASILCYAICFVVLAQAFRSIPVGVAYAIWSGVGILAIAIIGWIGFRQALSPAQMGFIALILVGAIGLQMTTKAH